MNPDLDLRERAELCDLLDRLGPDAPTLCHGWTTADLAAHLVVRERDLVGVPGILIGGKLGEITEKRMARELEKGYRAVVARVRSGPPFGPLRLAPLRAQVNLAEYVVHHEDVRRANALGRRTDREDLDAAVWPRLARMGLLLMRKTRPVGVVLRRADDGAQARAVPGTSAVTITGHPVELLLFMFGRNGAAEVELDGTADDVARVRRTKFGV